MVLTVVKVAVTVYLLLALGYLTVVAVRRVRARGLPELPPYPGAEAYLKAMFGPRPPTPLPEWAHRSAADPPDEDEDREPPPPR